MNFLLGIPAFCGVLAIAGLVSGCEAALAPESHDEALLRTDRLAHELQRDDRDNLRVRIPFTFQNGTGETVYLVNCNGSVSALPPEVAGRRVGDRVEPRRAALPEPPDPGRAGRGLRGHPASTRRPPGRGSGGPQFEVAELAGTYRLLWHVPVHDYDFDAPPGFGR